MRTRLAAPVAACLLVAGCIFPNLGAFGDGVDPFPTVIANYVAGTASMQLVQGGVTQDITLDRVGAGSALNSLVGATVT